MKSIKSFFAIFLFALLFTVPLFSQGIVGVKTWDIGTITNSVDHTIEYKLGELVREFGCNKIDSAVVSVTVQNETDIDSLEVYPINYTSGGTIVKGTTKHFAVTLNVAAGATGTEVLLSSGAGVAASLWRGYQGIQILTRGAAAGNDPTDPNSARVTITFYGS